MKLWMRFAPPLRRAVAAATEESAARGCDEVAVEHLLLAICRDPSSVACYVFQQAGLERESVLEMLEFNAPKGTFQLQRAKRLSSAALHLIDIAAGESDRLSHRNISAAHVALALTLTNHNVASNRLNQQGFTHEKAELAVRQWLADGSRLRRVDRSESGEGLTSRLPRPIRRMLLLPTLGWKIFVGKSLGHPGFSSNPYPLYRWLRTNAPVRKDPIAPVWVVTRYADVATVLKDPRFNKDPFATVRLPAMMREQLGISEAEVRTADVEVLSMLFLDPPQHTRVRSFFSRAFTPKMISGLRPRIQQITDKRLSKVMSAGKMDVIEAIACPLPVIVIAELLGFPPEDYPLYKKWSDDFTAALGLNPTPAEQAAAVTSRQELHEYFDRLVPKLARSPGDHLLGALLAMEDEPGGLSREEIFINSALLLAAGHETTTNLIGNGLWHLLNHPDQLALLRADPSLIESAVDELLRFDSPVQWVSRVVREPLELSGVPLKSGTIVIASLGSANRDPDQFTCPDRLDLRRSDNKHLSFGSGVHFCLGAALARMEAQIAIGTMLARLPNLRLASRKIRWKKGLIFRALHRLDVEFEPVGSAPGAKAS
jgi:cytochrome P450